VRVFCRGDVSRGDVSRERVSRDRQDAFACRKAPLGQQTHRRRPAAYRREPGSRGRIEIPGIVSACRPLGFRLHPGELHGDDPAVVADRGIEMGGPYRVDISHRKQRGAGAVGIGEAHFRRLFLCIRRGRQVFRDRSELQWLWRRACITGLGTESQEERHRKHHGRQNHGAPSGDAAAVVRWRSSFATR
jgi:hypothetical protein